MQCNPKKHASTVDPIQQMLNEANAQIKKHRADIKETFKSTNLKMSSLVRNTPSTSLEIEALEFETEALFTRLDVLLSSLKADLDRFTASVVIDMMVAAGHGRQDAQDWATRNLETIDKGYQLWEQQRNNIKGVFEAGKSRGWVEMRKMFIKTLGRERVMTTETWG